MKRVGGVSDEEGGRGLSKGGRGLSEMERVGGVYQRVGVEGFIREAPPGDEARLPPALAHPLLGRTPPRWGSKTEAMF